MVIDNFDRPSDDQLSALEQVDPNELGHHRHFGHSSPELRFMRTASSANIVGSALTVRIPPVDGTMVHKATELAEPGDVIVIQMDGHETNAPWGEVTTHAAVASGAQGVVIDGAVTDTAAIRDIDFPVFARARSNRTVYRLRQSLGGDINVPVQVGGAVVQPGDVAIGNEDGVVFVPQDEIDHVIEHYTGGDGAESEIIDRLYEGESLADISGANDRIAERDLS
ncbi:dimethylmenaquinone methyltransferase [Haloferax mediterranei ATCC 33500]|uniref:Demethylmenaquinone methyltransferase n=1 Tax=Haloferax mediterranei (strain ATCC 33500 / DSM 1411 / JCM 8866 / NBRC 14739 / NCIMB 2177 / R-4) TaxID=523841 RepID=I3R587_HALMT|nr:dimethylmenaquinone methyltransferase [Haloferax mediterranei]AFK19397.1 Demethylmenaquinone methyltransferase [Haloferax mediterranei ATCC 33500]AHZ21253.1 dimethylmenaquinone methyltransferase [Haloferax mediterranei ATCC 33500]EMA04414.1 Demethylmenaquinone methyltransferase [Haloferax mediterranei ATCC 33500]MDX5989500.1 dimethylmenaquinone methyltransferase [Haloferax mediterranei ATCC 33500]QCQ75859.1 dimethylmenaquinone methyltransferase [Haloferax mediterranei ATCC 33500]